MFLWSQKNIPQLALYTSLFLMAMSRYAPYHSEFVSKLIIPSLWRTSALSRCSLGSSGSKVMFWRQKLRRWNLRNTWTSNSFVEKRAACFLLQTMHVKTRKHGRRKKVWSKSHKTSEIVHPEYWAASEVDVPGPQRGCRVPNAVD